MVKIKSRDKKFSETFFYLENQFPKQFKNYPEKQKVFKEVLEKRMRHLRREKRERRKTQTLRFISIFITFSLLILSLIQIRYNIFPIQTLGFYISISVLTASIALIDSILAISNLRSLITFYQKEVNALKLTIKDVDRFEDADSLSQYYNDLINNNQNDET